MTGYRSGEQDDLLARMDWLIGAAPGLPGAAAGPGYGIAPTRYSGSNPDDPDFDPDCDGCICMAVRMAPCGHCENHNTEDGEPWPCGR